MQDALTLRTPSPVLRLRRGHLWTVIWVAMGAVAAYFLLPQAGELQESLGSLQHVQPGWVAAGAALVALRYTLAAVSLRAAVGRPLPFGPTLLVQASSAFIGRFTPEGVGWLVLNQRYLEKAGLNRTSAAAAISLKVLAGVVVRIIIMAAVASLVGASGVFGFDLSGSVYMLAVPVALVMIGFVLWRAFGSRATRAKASVAAAAKEFASVFRQPVRMAALLGSSAGLPIAYALALSTSARAFGVDVSFIDIFAVYLGGTAVAAASPTPGNLGAVEVTLSAGLIAVGVPSGAAVAAVLIYRLLTFWLPLVPGFFAFRYLQAKHHI
jgi:glycosyltransferase 2 family protein